MPGGEKNVDAGNRVKEASKAVLSINSVKMRIFPFTSKRARLHTWVLFSTPPKTYSLTLPWRARARFVRKACHSRR